MYNADTAINQLLQVADDAGLSDEALDELVIDITNQIASDTNNGGIEEQVKFIVAQMGPAGEARIREIIEEENDE